MLELFFISFQHRFLNLRTHVPVDRMRNILVCAVGPFPAGHRHKIATVPLDDFHSPNYEGIIEGDVGKAPEFLLISESNSYLRNFHASVPISKVALAT